MPTLLDAQIAGLAAGAGWSGNDVATATAVALAESDGNPAAIGDTILENSTWGPSVGLWQIRSLKSQTGTGGTRDQSANLDPATNARHAHDIWASSGWSAWTTYTTGAYITFMSRARTAAAGASSATPTDTTGSTGVTTIDFTPTGGGIPNPLAPLKQFIQLPGDMLGAAQAAVSSLVKVAVWAADRHNMFRFAEVLLGGGLLIGGLAIIARPVAQPIVEQGTAIASKAAMAAAL